MKLSIKRKEVPFIVSGLSQVKGMKDFTKAISLGRDSRVLKGIQDDTEEAIKKCKPDNYDELLDELNDLKRKKAQEIAMKEGEVVNDNVINTHVLLTWEKGKDWLKCNKEYNQAAEAISNEIIVVDVHTELTEKDFPKSAEDVSVAEVLSYFLKE